MEGAVLDGVGVDFAAAANPPPLQVPAEALRTEAAGVEEEGPAGAAEGEPELVGAAALPVAGSLGAGGGDGFGVVLLGQPGLLQGCWRLEVGDWMSSF